MPLIFKKRSSTLRGEYHLTLARMATINVNLRIINVTGGGGEREPSHALGRVYQHAPQPLGKCLQKAEARAVTIQQSHSGRISGLQTNSERHAAQGPGRAAAAAGSTAQARRPLETLGRPAARGRGAARRMLEHDSGAANSATARPRGTPSEPPRDAPLPLTGTRNGRPQTWVARLRTEGTEASLQPPKEGAGEGLPKGGGG